MMDRWESLAARVDALAEASAEEAQSEEGRGVVEDLLLALESGELRAAQRDADGGWHAVPWVKRGILLAFRAGVTTGMGRRGPHEGAAPFVDKDTMPPRLWEADGGVRVVPGGSSVRRGTFLGTGVVCMPPMYVNVGAWVGDGTMIDSHALVGSCAQIGARVHLSAAAQIGGVLEPINGVPVIIEDNVIVGGNAGVYEGTIVREGAVLGAGVILTRGTPVFDLVEERVIRADGGSLEIPENAVVVAGARAATSEWARAESVSIYTPVIVKYRDEKTDLATALEDVLRA